MKKNTLFWLVLGAVLAVPAIASANGHTGEMKFKEIDVARAAHCDLDPNKRLPAENAAPVQKTGTQTVTQGN